MTSPLRSDDDITSFAAYLLARRPTGLATANLGASGRHLGYAAPDGAATLPLHGDGPLLTTTNPTVMHEWLDDWRQLGRPGYAELVITTQQTDDTNWTIRAQLRDIPSGAAVRAPGT